MKLEGFNKREENIFVDANIFIYHLDKSSPYHLSCTHFLTKVENQEIETFTSTLVIDEILYGCLLLKASQMHPKLSINALKKRIGKDKKLVQECYKFVEEVFNYIEILRIIGNLIILEINFEIIKHSIPIAKEYSLLPRDAIHLATCQMFKIEHIATTDAHFHKIPFFTIWSP